MKARVARREAGDALSDDGYLSAYIRRRIRDSQDVEDYVQDVYVRVLQSTGNDAAPVENWRGLLRQAANTVIIDRYRRDKARFRNSHVDVDEDGMDIPDPAVNPEEDAERRQQLERVARTLDEADECCRRAFVMARVEGFAHREVADRLGIAVVAVSRCIEKILARLARIELRLEREGRP